MINFGIPKPRNIRIKLSEDEDPENTALEMLRIARENSHQTKELARMLEGETIHETCESIWEWVRKNIEYKKEEGEELRTPAASYHDGVGDCDCMSIMTGAILCNLHIDFAFRLGGYWDKRGNPEDGYSHVYTVAYDEEGKEIVIDCVPQITYFGEEAHNHHYKDFQMTHELAGVKKRHKRHPVAGLGEAYSVDISENQTGEELAYNGVRLFIVATNKELDKAEQGENPNLTAIAKERGFLRAIEQAINDHSERALGKAIKEAYSGSVFPEAYKALADAVGSALEQEGKSLAGLGNFFSNIASGFGDAVGKAAGAIDLLAGGQRRRAQEQNDANARLAEMALQAEREKTAQAEKMAQAEIAKAEAQKQTALATRTQTQTAADGGGEAAGGSKFGDFMKKWWIAIVGGVLAIIAVIFFIGRAQAKAKAKEAEADRARKQVEGLRRKQREAATQSNKRGVSGLFGKRKTAHTNKAKGKTAKKKKKK